LRFVAVRGNIVDCHFCNTRSITRGTKHSISRLAPHCMVLPPEA